MIEYFVMAGGLMSLLAVGTQDQYLTVAPEMSYFRQVYKRCTNFSMESVQQTFMTKPVIETSRSSFTCRINRVGDLLQQIYLSFELPNIYSDENFRFRWVKNIASVMLYSYSVRIDTQLIDQKWGEWMEIWNELTMTTDKKDAFKKMSGNDEAYVDPKSFRPLALVRNNRITYSTYAAATGPDVPSIRKRRFYIPMDFWFCKNPTLALPLVGLQYQNVEVTIELRGIDELYQLWDPSTSDYVSPTMYKERYPSANVNISQFLAYGGGGPSTVDLNAYLDCNFIFLDEAERRMIAAKNMDFLVERVYRIEKGGIANVNTIDLQVANPIKEMVWVLRRSDAVRYNDWTNFTGSIPENDYYPILASAKIMWNGMERVEEKTAEYFGKVQPWQHHSMVPKDGIYCYSYALYPEKLQPSGSFNASMVPKMQLYVTTNSYPDVTEYEAVVYHTYYNIFRVMSGSGGMVFQS